jgi:putative membrane protein
MHYDGMGFFGMHALWWLFWIVLMVTIFSMAEVTLKSKTRRGGTPLELLQHRYAAGEISSEEYTERKAKLEADR